MLARDATVELFVNLAIVIAMGFYTYIVMNLVTKIKNKKMYNRTPVIKAKQTCLINVSLDLLYIN